MTKKNRTTEQHNAKMKKIKVAMDKRIAAADVDRGVVVLITGNGKGKSSSGFGMVVRALGHGFKAGVVQFIKQANSCGEQLYLASREPKLKQYAMDTGFTWDTQDKKGDIAAAKRLDVSGDLVQCQHHVLEAAYNSLTPARQALLGRIACFRSPVNYDALKAIVLPQVQQRRQYLAAVAPEQQEEKK